MITRWELCDGPLSNGRCVQCGTVVGTTSARHMRPVQQAAAPALDDVDAMTTEELRVEVRRLRAAR